MFVRTQSQYQCTMEAKTVKLEHMKAIFLKYVKQTG